MPDVSSARAERLVNLVLCLLSTRQFLSAERIRTIVPGYADAPNDEAFFRMFERDKTELRELGVPLESGRRAIDTADGYRIARQDYELGEIDLESDEAAAVALAARLWESPELAGPAHGALVKLRAAGVEVDEDQGRAQPRVRGGEPAFGPLLAAVQAGRAVAFDYRRGGPAGEVARRTVEPWGVVSWRGRWYVVGHDLERRAERCFRLSRIVGQVKRTGRAGAYTPPEDIDLISYVARWTGPIERTGRARVLVPHGRGAGVRRWADEITPGPDGDVLTLRYAEPEWLAAWLVGYGADVVVLDPLEVRDPVIARLRAIAERHTQAPETAPAGVG
jgi:proteasome accessory factor B